MSRHRLARHALVKDFQMLFELLLDVNCLVEREPAGGGACLRRVCQS
ncbi:MAG: hypothetical protein WD872_18995 [Pirellulaceae bacterium]